MQAVKGCNDEAGGAPCLALGEHHLPNLSIPLGKGTGRKTRPGSRYLAFLDTSCKAMAEIKASPEPGAASLLPTAMKLGFTQLFAGPQSSLATNFPFFLFLFILGMFSGKTLLYSLYSVFWVLFTSGKTHEHRFLTIPKSPVPFFCRRSSHSGSSNV